MDKFVQRFQELRTLEGLLRMIIPDRFEGYLQFNNFKDLTTSLIG